MKKMTITEVLKRAVRDSGETIYSIAKETGLEQASLRRFMSGKRSLRLDLADKLAIHLGVAIALVNKPKQPKPGPRKLPEPHL